MRMYLELAKLAFQQQFAYRAATLAGLFTNSIFGLMLSSVYLALYWDKADGASVAGFTADQTITYTWIGQAMIMPVIFLGLVADYRYDPRWLSSDGFPQADGLFPILAQP